MGTRGRGIIGEVDVAHSLMWRKLLPATVRDARIGLLHKLGGGSADHELCLREGRKVADVIEMEMAVGNSKSKSVVNSTRIAWTVEPIHDLLNGTGFYSTVSQNVDDITRAVDRECLQCFVQRWWIPLSVLNDLIRRLIATRAEKLHLP